MLNSVSQSHAGIASGDNNAVSRTAGLLAVAVLGLIMFHSFNSCLDRRLDQMAVTSEVRRALGTERIKLAAAQIPSGTSRQVSEAIKQALDECFVFGFRRVILAGVVFALASSLIAWLMIRGR